MCDRERIHPQKWGRERNIVLERECVCVIERENREKERGKEEQETNRS